MSRFEISGPEADWVVDMMADAASYLAGPGLDGFMEWAYAQYPQACITPEHMRQNLEQLAAMLDARLSS